MGGPGCWRRGGNSHRSSGRSSRGGLCRCRSGIGSARSSRRACGRPRPVRFRAPGAWRVLRPGASRRSLHGRHRCPLARMTRTGIPSPGRTVRPGRVPARFGKVSQGVPGGEELGSARLLHPGPAGCCTAPVGARAARGVKSLAAPVTREMRAHTSRPGRPTTCAPAGPRPGPTAPATAAVVGGSSWHVVPGLLSAGRRCRSFWRKRSARARSAPAGNAEPLRHLRHVRGVGPGRPVSVHARRKSGDLGQGRPRQAGKGQTFTRLYVPVPSCLPLEYWRINSPSAYRSWPSIEPVCLFCRPIFEPPGTSR